MNHVLAAAALRLLPSTERVCAVGTGVFLAVLGAILTFAVRDEMPNVDLTVVGLILMIAGGVIIWHARQGSIRERVITEVDGVDETASPRTVRKVIRDRDVE